MKKITEDLPLVLLSGDSLETFVDKVSYNSPLYVLLGKRKRPALLREVEDNQAELLIRRGKEGTLHLHTLF